jgi:hypothetical protein
MATNCLGKRAAEATSLMPLAKAFARSVNFAITEFAYTLTSDLLI